MTECVYLTFDGCCILHRVGSDVREPCVLGPCDDERLPETQKEETGE